jgi:hypothetical protein
MAYEQQTRTDKFGNTTVLKKASTVVNKKSGEVVDGCFKTYLETTGKNGKSELIKVEISACNTEDKNGNPAMWVKFTKQEERKKQTSNRF